MNDMLDALLAALPNSAYFERKDFGEDLREKLSAADVPFACYLRGATAWDLAKQPIYPFYSACKTNTEDNTVFIPYREGSVVLSSVETGELVVFLMREDEGKAPPPRAAKGPGATSTLPRAKTYSVTDIWRSISAENLCGGYGDYQAYLLAGDFQSQPYAFKAIPTDNPPVPPPFEGRLKAKTLPESAEPGIQGAKFDPVYGLEPPKEPGVILKHGKATTKGGVPVFPVSGAFRFKGEWNKEYERMPLHFLFSQAGERELDVNTLFLPLSMCRFKDGYYTAEFSFDLAGFFVSSGDGAVKAPKQAWISKVHRGWRGPIGKVELPSAP
jgi:hypothetical protein